MRWRVVIDASPNSAIGGSQPALEKRMRREKYAKYTYHRGIL